MAVAEGPPAAEPPSNIVDGTSTSNPNANPSSLPSISPPTMSPTSSPPQRPSPTPSTLTTTPASASATAAANASPASTPASATAKVTANSTVNTASGTPIAIVPTTTTSSSTTTTNTPRLQRVEFLYTATPVEGCDLLPYVVLRTPSGEVKSAESIEAKTRGALSVQYRWNRCAATYTCATKHCFKSAQQQFVPLLKVAASHVLPPDQFDQVIKQSFFCSMKCLKAAWPTLRKCVQTITSSFPRRDKSLKTKLQSADNSSSTATKSSVQTSPPTDTIPTQHQTSEPVQNEQSTNGADHDGKSEVDHVNNNSSSITSTSSTTTEVDDEHSECENHVEDVADRYDSEYESMRSHTVIVRNDGVFRDPLPNPIKVAEVAFIRNYAPTADDVGHVLELVCRYVQRNADGSVHVGPPLSIRSSSVLPTPEPPPERRMYNLSNGEMYPMKNRRPGTLRVMTYNILAEIYATKEHYQERQCPSWALAWTFRKRRLISEMSKYDSDVLCLQEVQADHYEDHFQPYFSRKGYDSCFKGKTREAMGRRGKIDGCATFFRKDLFSLREQLVIEYNMIAQARCKEPRTLNRVLKGNVGQILILDAQDGSGPIIVANTHLYWDPELADVKLFQVDAFMQELELLIQTRGLPQDIPIILSGDFNSTPDSSVYELLSTGTCMLAKHDMPEDTAVLNACRMRHNLRMRSSYSHMGGEPAFTNYTSTFKGVLDYIWYASDSVMPTAVLEVPTQQVLLGKNRPMEALSDEERGIPNEQWSSDHIALVADFQLLKRTSIGHATM